jgi:Raf kinase inhibitor-like YbhB/YbcL family protein
VWNVPKDTAIIEENNIPMGATVGVNDKGAVGYIRPTPLKGSGIHRYIFELYALDISLNLPYDESRASIEKIISAHVIGKAELTGLYSR